MSLGLQYQLNVDVALTRPPVLNIDCFSWMLRALVRGYDSLESYDQTCNNTSLLVWYMRHGIEFTQPRHLSYIAPFRPYRRDQPNGISDNLRNVTAVGLDITASGTMGIFPPNIPQLLGQ